MIDGEQSVPESRAQLTSRIAELDQVISSQLNEILHHPEFQVLEATWRGLSYLVSRSLPGQSVKIKILHVQARDLLKDFQRAAEVDKSEIFKKIYDDVYQTAGAPPFGMLLGAYEFGGHLQPVALLQYLSQLAALAHMPFISAASPSMFQWEDFRELQDSQHPAEILNSPEYLRWQSFRQSEESTYTGLCLPHILLRDPYNLNAEAKDSFNFQESLGQKDLLWGNAAFAFGACVAGAFKEKGWLGKVTGTGSDGLVENLYFQYFQTADKENADKFSLDAAISPEKDVELSNAGFIPLVENSFIKIPAFFSSQSCHKSPVYESAEATVIARRRAQLTSVFAAARFAHYLMVLARDRAQPFNGREECEQALNNWLAGYARFTAEPLSKEENACYPLREARIEVQELADKPGKFRALIYLHPTYQLEDLVFAMRVIVFLP